ncbi:MAG: YidC/Oxa1 family membrane protein insertase, partial [Acutalibacteraceae bacterium]
MESIFGPILYRPMGWFFNLLFELTGNIGVAIFLLTLTVNVILFPLSIRQQKTMAKQTALKPKLDKLREKYADNQQKLSQEMQNLYANEGVSMTGGCLTSLLRLPFLWGIYMVIRNPLKYMLGLSTADALAAYRATLGSAAANKIQGDLYLMSGEGLNFLKSSEAYTALVEGASRINMRLFGLDLGVTPSIKEPGVYWIFPIFAFAMAFLSTYVMMRQNKVNNPESAKMGGMMYFMPFVSLYISFIVPSALGLYWGFS